MKCKKIIGIFLSVLLMVSILLSTAACSVKIHAEDMMQGIKARNNASLEDIESGNIATADFAVRLFKESYQDDKNTLISSLSVLCALAMTTNGAEGNTREQMETVLGASCEYLNLYLYTYINSLPTSQKCKLNLANSIWINADERFEANQDFLQINADYYGAGAYKAPFNSQTLKDINNWIKKETDGTIPKVLNDIPQEAVMYLVNALAFDAEWANVYERTQVRDGKFTKDDGAEQKVKLMYSTEGKYLENNSSKGFIKYYKGGEYAFVALLPNENISLSDYVSTLDGKALSELLKAAEARPVETAIPKFETEYEVQMAEVLKAMGMTDAFNPDAADFSGLGTSEHGNIFIDRVIHKAFIKVGEKGTKAGAATVIEMLDKSSASPDEMKYVYLTRPFVYMLVDCKNNVPFFIGANTSIE